MQQCSQLQVFHSCRWRPLLTDTGTTSNKLDFQLGCLMSTCLSLILQLYYKIRFNVRNQHSCITTCSCSSSNLSPHVWDQPRIPDHSQFLIVKHWNHIRTPGYNAYWKITRNLPFTRITNCSNRLGFQKSNLLCYRSSGSHATFRNHHENVLYSLSGKGRLKR